MKNHASASNRTFLTAARAAWAALLQSGDLVGDLGQFAELRRPLLEVVGHLGDPGGEARVVRFDADAWFFMTPEQFERKLMDRAEAEFQQALAELFNNEVFVYVEALRNPAQAARKLLDDLIAKAAFTKPIKLGDFTIRIKDFDPKNFKQSMFSPSPGLTVEIAYLDGQLMAEASGFYFRRDLTPVFDHLKLKSTAEDLAKKAVSQG